jgi:hypothetical protein
MNLTDHYRVFRPSAAQYTFFSVAHENFSEINHILRHKEVLTEVRKLKLLPVFYHTVKE